MMTNPIQSLLLVALPYAAIVVFVVGMVWRLRRRYSISSLSSQVLESRFLPWGSVPFHLGIVILVAGHLLPLLFPAWWQRLVVNRTALLALESAGAAAALLCLVGLVVLAFRRLLSPSVRPVSTAADLLVLAILISQVAIGFALAMLHRWGAVWSARTTTPYLWSLVTLQPDPAFVAGAPLLLTLHISLAWMVLALIPFTRLVHLFFVPLGYLRRPPQKVVWSSAR